MTPEHLIFIPTVFLLGLLSGQLVAGRSYAGLPVLFALWLVLAVFALTHLTTLPFGPGAVREASGGLSLFDQRPSFSTNEVLERIDMLGPKARTLYQRLTYTGDVIFPLSLLAFFISLARYVQRRVPVGAAWRPALLLLPAVWFFADMAENAIIFTLIGGFPSPNMILASLLGPLTLFKLVLLPASLVAPLLALMISGSRQSEAEI